MACNCGKKKTANGFTVTKGNGETEQRSTELEASALALRTKGTYVRNA